MTDLVFKTIHTCRVDLIAHSQYADFNAQYDTMDYMPAVAARVSFGNEAKIVTKERDVKLMDYLAQHKHMTPFEYQHATFMIECPLFIRSQIHRHRTFSYNEISRRYTSDDLEFWMPDSYRLQSQDNKQATLGKLSDSEQEQMLLEMHIQQCKMAHDVYQTQLSAGVGREMARSLLPQALLTRFYMGGNLRNWAHFLQLRLDSHAQYEVQIPAQKIRDHLKSLWPVSMDVLGL